MRKYPGVSTPRSSGLSESGARGRELIISWIWHTRVRSSSKPRI